MGKFPPIAIIGITVALAIGLSCVAFFVKMKPMKVQLADIEKNLSDEQAVADRKKQAEDALAQANVDWLQSQATLAVKMHTRGKPISFGEPIIAMIALWYEYREDLPPLIERFVQASGCTLVSGTSFPAPPMTPPAAPASGFLQEPGNQTINLTVRGSLANIERLYRSLPNWPRVVTVGSLSLTGEGDNLTATVPLTFYLLVEVPPGVAAAAAPAAGGGPGGAGMMPMGGGAPAGAPPGGGGSAKGAPKAASKAGGDDDSAKGGAGKKAGGGGGED
jgi:hypothetical protein